MAKIKAYDNNSFDEAYLIMAGLIRVYGEKYLPIFKRLHEERELRKANLDLRDIALQVASSVIK